MEEEKLIRYICNELSKDEKLEVEKWLEESPGNEKELGQIYFTYILSEKQNLMNRIDTESALSRFKSRLHQKTQVARFRRFVSYAQRAAAFLFIPLLLAAGYFYYTTQKEKDRFVEVASTPGMVSSFTLPDGSTVWLNSGGKLRYPIRFSSSNRVVKLSGEACFKVTKDKSKPFIVETDHHYDVEVLGTFFNVSDFENDKFVSTTLVEGSVRLKILSLNGKEELCQLKPGQKAVYNKGNHSLEVKSVDAGCDVAWKDGYILLRKIPMGEVLEKLERRYNVLFSVKDPDVLKSVITARFDNEQLPEVLNYLQLASDVKFKIKRQSSIKNDTLIKSIIEVSK